MRNFRVLIRGENFQMEVEGDVKRLGFYVTRLIEAVNENEAERLAIESIRLDDRLRNNVLNDESDSPRLFVDEIEEVSTSEDTEHQETGFTFFDD